jgi:MFS transporter, CP family, cyanate transporter
MIALRTRTSDGTAALSGFTQAVGYAISIAGPLGISIAYDATGGWTLPLLLLTAAAVGTAAVGTLVSRPGYVEDQLPSDRREGSAA